MTETIVDTGIIITLDTGYSLDFRQSVFDENLTNYYNNYENMDEFQIGSFTIKKEDIKHIEIYEMYVEEDNNARSE